MASSSIPVLIVGAGPSGLVAALNLAKNGIHVRIIEKQPKFQIGSRGGGIQARSLELFHFLGVLPELFERGIPLFPRRQYKLPGGKEVLEEGWMSAPTDPTPSTPYNHVWIISQENLEDILRSHLAKYSVHVELSTELRSLEQDVDHVTTHIIKRDGDKEKEETIVCQYMIGTDGGRGITRKLLGLNFVGASREAEGAVVGEIEVEGLTPDAWHQWGDMSTKMTFLRPTEFPGVFYLGCGGSVDYQLIINDRDALVQFLYEATDRRDLKFGAVSWIGEFRPNVRMVDSFGKGRVFVAGDAAHVHSPTGGQGTNSSVQDSFNLTWKLALVLKGVSSPSLLASYDAERAPVIHTMLGYTTALLNKLRDASTGNAGSNAAAWARGRELQQLGVNYRWSTIVLDDRTPTRPEEELKALAYGGASLETEAVQAGDRARDAPGLVVGGVSAQTRLFDIFSPTHHTVLVFADSSAAQDVEAVIRALAVYPKEHVRVALIYPRGSEPAGTAAAGTIRLVDEQGHAYEGYSFDGAKAEVGKLPIVVVRPDAVVGAVTFGVNGVQQYFGKVFDVEK